MAYHGPSHLVLFGHEKATRKDGKCAVCRRGVAARYTRKVGERLQAMPLSDAPLCACGCGLPTNRVKQTINTLGLSVGQYRRFRRNHRGHVVRDSQGVIVPRGYRKIMRPEHHRADSEGYVREHILIAEKAVGKPLPEGAQVHHVNGIKYDNRPENLVVCQDGAYHNVLHQRTRAWQRCGHADWVPCMATKAYYPRSEMRELSHGHFYHPKNQSRG